jgi:hypothetical protein
MASQLLFEAKTGLHGAFGAFAATRNPSKVSEWGVY